MLTKQQRVARWPLVKKSLEDLGRETMTRFPYLNSGACGLYAAMVGTRLQQIGNNARIVMSGSAGEYRSINHIARVFGEDDPWLIKEGRVTHVMLRIYGEVYDSTGFYKIREVDPVFRDKWFFGSCHPKRFLATAKAGHIWNYGWLNKVEQKELQKLIDKHLPLESRA